MTDLGEMRSVRAGTPLYLAPEVWKGNSAFTIAVDVFSYAITLWELVTGRRFSYPGGRSEGQVKEKILRGVRREIPDTVPQPYVELINACWEGDPARRPTFAEIVHRPVESWSFPGTDVSAVSAYRQGLIDALSG
jgi:serine/threonine protein kinase